MSEKQETIRRIRQWAHDEFHKGKTLENEARAALTKASFLRDAALMLEATSNVLDKPQPKGMKQ